MRDICRGQGAGNQEGRDLVQTVTNTWEPNRDLLDVKGNKFPSTSTPISRFDCHVNAINQRTQVQTTGSAFPSQPADWNWGYDALSQVTSAGSLTNTECYSAVRLPNRAVSANTVQMLGRKERITLR